MEAKIEDFENIALGDRILMFLLKTGVAYTSEIQRETEGYQELINSTLANLKNKGFIKKFYWDKYSPPRVIAIRIPEMWESRKKVVR